ncbi:MAG TPA: hypothetical protein DEH25_11850 [Chloroflexi bacterium]|nr:hypothetical protein [Chloroflexota bacterium]HBY08560.1 hypothetical protein [Chloroflexota bacterium]
MFDALIRFLNAALMIALPLGLGVYLSRKLDGKWRLFGVGALTFVASQVFHIPFNAWILNPLLKKLDLQISDPVLQLAVVALLLGLSAGVFEEVSRYLVYRFWLVAKSDRTWRSALMFGAGHGGIEAIILGVLGLYAFVQLVAYRNADLSAIVTPEQLDLAKLQVETYWSLPWYAALLGAVERAAAICFHLSATVLVLQAFRRKNIFWLFLAIGWHTILDAVAVFGAQSWGTYVTEGLIVSLGLLGLVIVFLLREPAEIQDVLSPEDTEPAQIEIQPQKPSIETLEDSRYV